MYSTDYIPFQIQEIDHNGIIDNRLQVQDSNLLVIISQRVDLHPQQQGKILKLSNRWLEIHNNLKVKLLENQYNTKKRERSSSKFNSSPILESTESPSTWHLCRRQARNSCRILGIELQMQKKIIKDFKSSNMEFQPAKATIRIEKVKKIWTIIWQEIKDQLERRTWSHSLKNNIRKIWENSTTKKCDLNTLKLEKLGKMSVKIKEHGAKETQVRTTKFLTTGNKCITNTNEQMNDKLFKVKTQYYNPPEMTSRIKLL